MKQRVASLLITFGFVVAACSGGSGSDATDGTTTVATDRTGALPTITDPPATGPPSTDPPVTEPPATDPPQKNPPSSDPTTSEEPSSDTERIETAGNGLLTMRVAAGWEVTFRRSSPGKFYGNDPWEITADGVEVVFGLSKGDVELVVFREGRYSTVPDVKVWTSALLDFSETTVDVSTTHEFAGGPGQTVSGTTPDDEVIRFVSTTVGGQFLAFAVVSPEELSDETSDQVDAMLDSVVIDPSVVPLLAHSIEMNAVIDAASTGATPWEMGVLAPTRWQPTDLALQWEDPDGDGFAEYWTSPATDDFATMVAAEMDVRGDAWLSETPTIDTWIVDRVAVKIYWDGDPETATAAIVMSHDDVVFTAAYLFAPDPSGLLQEMVDSIAFPVSSFNPG